MVGHPGLNPTINGKIIRNFNMENYNWLKKTIKRIIKPQLRRHIKSFMGLGQFEEVEIVYKLLKENVKARVMVDVGSHEGNSLINFAHDKWRVYAFEPDAVNRSILKKICCRFTSVTIDSRAVSNKDEKKLPFFTSKLSSGISGLSSFHDTHKESQKVDTVSLETFFKEEGISEVGFLKVDTEGFDMFVLLGIPWDNIKPEVILCEFEDKKTLPLGYTFHDMASFLVERGYHLLVSEWYPIIEYGSVHRWRRLVAYPCDLLDKNGWGNIIAVGGGEVYKRLCSIANIYSNRFSR